MTSSSQKDLIDSVYNVALQPDRYDELTLIWKDRLTDALVAPEEHTLEFIDDVQRSLKILEAMTYGETREKPVLSDFETSQFAVITVSEKGELLEGNPAASQAFGDLSDRTLSDLPYDIGSIEALQAGVASSMRTKGARPELVRAIKSSDGSQSLISIRFHAGVAGRRSCAILQTSDFVWPDYLLPLLKSAFGLTQAEAQITRMMTEGLSLSAIAATRNSSVATVRTQMRSIFQKTEAHSQTELVRMAIAFVALHDLADGAPTLDAAGYLLGAGSGLLIYPRNEDRHVLPLPDGRRLDYAVIGDPDGVPILHLSPVLWGDYWPARTAQKLIKNGLKVITPARSGYLRSSTYPRDRSPVAQYAQDVKCLMSELGLESASVLARGMGAMFVYEIISQFPSLVRGMVLIGPELPFRSEDVYKDVSPGHRFILTATLKYPKLLELYIGAARIYFKRARTRAFIEKNFANAKEDFYLLDDPQIWEAKQAGLETTYAGGTLSILQTYEDVKNYDYQQIVSCRIPTTVILGSSDASPRRAIVKNMIAEGASFDLIELEDVAEFCFFAKPDLIINCLKRISAFG